ncbi:Bax inhibitor-1/YccA family protein [Clostridium sp. BJN0001]|uniref:Bax inhibitor-1/YccA family protein n=1 Tax=Clostridium sp. BJN0001 TaxID=2930219 RepID=UPI001FD220F3|nr:Bax inhibitor-1/YccA family protein [Clostridium sp. BJN0001]
MSELSYTKSESGFINKTFTYMATGLLVTFVIGFFISQSINLRTLILTKPQLSIGLAILEVALVLILSRRINKMSASSALMMFFLYSILNGLTFSAIFVVYDLSSIMQVFILASIMFFCCAMAGKLTNKDLSSLGRISIMAVIGIIIATVFNFFINSEGLSMIISYVAVAVFCALTAYDMQTLKRIHNQIYYSDAESANKYAILGALTLYLDFINLFLHLLRLFGNDN